MAPSFNSEQAALLRVLEKGENPLEALQWARRETSIDADGACKVWQFAQGRTDARRRAGAYYTSEAAARVVARQAIATMDRPPQRILEPSCGGGALLGAILHEGPAVWGCSVGDLARSIEAWDLDPAGLMLARWRVEEAFGLEVAEAITWRATDTLEASPEVRLDWIFGNPPFGNAIERATRRSKAQRARYARAFPLAARGAFDKCALFIEWATHHICAGGRITYILPRSWLAQPASTALRQELARRFHVHTLAHLSDDTFFEASVSTIALTLVQTQHAPQPTRILTQDGATQDLDAHALLLEGNWGAALHPFASVLTHVHDDLMSIDGCADFAAGASTAEAYAWKEWVEDTPTHRVQELGEGLRSGADLPSSKAEAGRGVAGPKDASDRRALLIAGRIDPFTQDWGVVPTRYLGDDYLHPTLPLSVLSERRRALHTRPRALLPTLSVALEATVDLRAECIGAVSTICAWPRDGATSEDAASSGEQDGAVLLLAAMLNSAWCRLQYNCLFSSLALQGGNTQVSKNKLRALRIPAPWHTLMRDAPRRSAVQPNAALSRVLASYDLPTLDKKLPSLDRWWVLVASAERLSKAWGVSELRAHLFALLYTQPRTGLRTAQIDVLLLAVAPDVVRTLKAWAR